MNTRAVERKALVRLGFTRSRLGAFQRLPRMLLLVQSEQQRESWIGTHGKENMSRFFEHSTLLFISHLVWISHYLPTLSLHNWFYLSRVQRSIQFHPRYNLTRCNHENRLIRLNRLRSELAVESRLCLFFRNFLNGSVE